MRRRIALLVLAVAALMGVSAAASAHPLGNFTINQHVGVSARDELSLSIEYVVDMAEIPAVRELARFDTSGQNLESAATEMCGDARTGLDVRIDGSRQALDVVSSTADTPEGQSSLPTLRVTCSFHASIDDVPATLVITNHNHGDRIGWREVVIDESLMVETDLPRRSPSATLTSYPDGDPLDITSAEVVVTGLAPHTPPEPRSTQPVVSTIPAMLGDLLGSRANLGPVAVLAALALGAVHALAPGHGKTLVAAYLVGEHGRPRHAVGLGLATAISHTIGVAALGVVTLVASESFAPERLYPVLSIASGLIITAVGGLLLARAVRGRRAHHHHDHNHDHIPPPTLTWKGMAAMGLAGGLVPSASAVVLLLGAIHLGRPVLGLVLVGLFGVGMSAVLVASGVAVLSTRRLAVRFLSASIRTPEWLRPAAACVVVILGAVLTTSAVQTLAAG